MEVKVKVWIEDENKNLIFGHGKTEILEQIEKTGSISKASQEIGMNYKKAWSHIKILEEFIEDDLVVVNGNYELNFFKIVSIWLMDLQIILKNNFDIIQLALQYIIKISSIENILYGGK